MTAGAAAQAVCGAGWRARPAGPGDRRSPGWPGAILPRGRGAGNRQDPSVRRECDPWRPSRAAGAVGKGVGGRRRAGVLALAGTTGRNGSRARRRGAARSGRRRRPATGWPRAGGGPEVGDLFAWRAGSPIWPGSNSGGAWPGCSGGRRPPRGWCSCSKTCTRPTIRRWRCSTSSPASCVRAASCSLRPVAMLKPDSTPRLAS